MDYDPYADLIAANRDEVLRMHEEAIRRVRKRLELALTDEKAWSEGIKDAMAILDALRLFHPMHGESWHGWPAGSE